MQERSRTEVIDDLIWHPWGKVSVWRFRNEVLSVEYWPHIEGDGKRRRLELIATVSLPDTAQKIVFRESRAFDLPGGGMEESLRQVLEYQVTYLDHRFLMSGSLALWEAITRCQLETPSLKQ